ncbi:HMP-PP phosphatase [Deinococcus metalli]|uniref:HMP-PP phosphatase n=1 Tax=Deinococcus metalli TaxID=1141878 RepID=A0A7W8NQI3_9DEIO|nr:HAD family hydrolase [Deinococcus metalli]MBB5376820.1 HMP-PP phosphatase [Deinococcus metalli]GHF45597.1 hydrolase [Deinococcus metalli]
MSSATSAEPPRLLAFDLDGTVVEDGGMRVPARTRGALARLRAQGVAVAVITGRDDVPPDVMDALAPDAVALHTGSLILRGEEVVHQVSLTAGEIAAVQARRPPGGHLLALTRGCVYADLSPLPDVDAWRTRWALAHRPFMPFDPLPAGGVMGLWCFHDDIGTWRAGVEATCPHLPIVGAQPPYMDNMNVSPAGVHKGMALERVAAALDVPLERAWAFGDSDNDLPMFAVAGRAVQVGTLPLLAGHAHHRVEDVSALGAWLDAHVMPGLAAR